MFPARKSVILFAFLFSLIVAGCSSSDSPSEDGNSAGPDVELTISAAASLTDALQEIRTIYEKERSNITLLFNFGSSGSLKQQIEQGAPADLFLSASANYMNELVEQKLVDPAQQTSLLMNELVVVVPADGKIKVAAMTDLTQADIHHIALGIPETVPAGSYAKDALTYAKLWDSLKAKFVQAKDVRQVLTYVETGNAEAGFVYKTGALTSDQVIVAFAVDPASYTPIEYPVGIVKATKHADEAMAFYQYLQSDEAQSVFEKYGFTMP